MKPVQVLAVASELYPLIKTGGLADVAGALPQALGAHGVAVRTLAPGYPAVLAAMKSARTAHAYDDLFGGPAHLRSGTAAGLKVFALDAPHLYRRAGGPYADDQGRDWPDNALRFAALARVGADLGQGLLNGYAPDIVHAHDWQAAMTAAYLHYDGRRRPGTVMTVHNPNGEGVFRGLRGIVNGDLSRSLQF